jgi:hypothetical protein
MPQRVPQHRPRHMSDVNQRRLLFDRQRNADDAWRRFINSRQWRKCAKSYLRSHPLCQRCEAAGLPIPAREVHHLRGQSEEHKYDHAHMIALCTSCHSAITIAETKSKQTSASETANVDE